MFKNKKKLLVAALILLGTISLCGCGKKNEYGVDTSKTYTDERDIVSKANDSDFVLGTPKGVVQLYDKTGKILDTLSLSKSSKSDFIYCEDSGEIFSKNLLTKDEFNCVLYAVDKADGRLYIIQNKGNKLKLFDTISLKASTKITDIKAYNGTFYYMVKGNGINAKKYTVAKTDSVPNALSYTTQVGIQRRGKTYSYVYINNLVDTYVEAMGIKSKLDDADITNLNVPAIKKETIILPYDVDSWTVTNNSVAFCAKDVYGSYDLNTDIITFCYGTTSSIDMAYRPGRYSSFFALNQMGDITSKSILFEIDTDELTIDSALEFNENVPLGMYLDNSSNVLYIIYKLDNKATYGKLKIYDLNKNKEINNITFDFVPTDVKGHNGMYYVMNSYESFMVYGENTSKKYQEISKYVKEVNASSLLLCNIYKKDYFTYDKQGRYIDDEGRLLDYRGNIINIKNQKVNKYGQVLDNYGRAINANGELVDRFNNVIDENGVIVKYTQQADGYYRSSKGIIVDETGKAMIKQEDGTYIKDVEEIPALEWHFDENGEVIINQDYLDKYPDAASWIDKDGNITKGQYVDTTNADEKEEKADDNAAERLIDKLIFWK